MNRQLSRNLAVIGIILLNVVPPTVNYVWFKNETTNLGVQLADLRVQIAEVKTRDERIQALESELSEKRLKLEEVYDDIDRVYVKWNDAEDALLTFKAQYRGCILGKE